VCPASVADTRHFFLASDSVQIATLGGDIEPVTSEGRSYGYEFHARHVASHGCSSDSRNESRIAHCCLAPSAA